MKPSLCLAAMCWLLGLLAVPAGAQQGTPEFDGFIEPLHDVQVAAGEIGVIAELAVALGDRVEAGQTIAVLDDQLQRIAVDIAETAASMQGTVDAAKVEYQLHKHRAQQLQQLAAEGLTRPDELRRAEADLEMAAGRLLAAQEEIAMRHAELTRARAMLQRRTITAPISGVIAKIFREAGEHVSPTDPDIVRLISDESLVAVVNIPARLVSRNNIGDRVRVLTTAPRQSVSATILTVSPVIDGQSGTVQIKALLDTPVGRCRAGDRCTVHLQPRNSQQALGESRMMK